MRKTKKKDNPGANIGNALLGCIVLAVITVGFAIEMRKEGVGESAIMGIVFLSFFWAIMLAVLVTALWRRSNSDAVPKVRNLGPKAIVCLMGFFFATVGGGALFIEFSRALAKGTPLVSLEVLGMAAFLSIFFLLGLVMIGIGVKAFVGNKPRIARAVYGEALKRCGHVGRFEPHYHVTISCDALKPGAIVLVNYSLDGNGDADGLDVDGLEVFVWQVNEELRFLADGDNWPSCERSVRVFEASSPAESRGGSFSFKVPQAIDSEKIRWELAFCTTHPESSNVFRLPL